MKLQAKFTEAEWEILWLAPMVSGLAVISCEFTIISAAIEFSTLIRELAAAEQRYPNSELIRALYGNTSEASIQDIVQQAKAQLMELIDETDPTESWLTLRRSPVSEIDESAIVQESNCGQHAITVAIELLQEALNILHQHVDINEIDIYKAFTFDCAVQIANAAGEGLIGRGGRVSPREAETLQRIQAVLD